MKTLALCAALFLSSTPNRAASPAIRFSTYLGGFGSDLATAIATGTDGSIYVTGIGGVETTTPHTLDNGGRGAFVTKLSADGSTVIYSTLIGGFFPRAITVDAAGQVYLAGHSFYDGFPSGDVPAGGFDAAIVKLNALGTQALFAKYFGGTDDETALSIGIDGGGKLWVAGLTASADFSVTNQPFQPSLAGNFDGFLARFSGDQGALEYATFIGGTNGNNLATAIAIDSTGAPLLAGRTSSPNFPIKNALQSTNRGGSDAFLMKFDPTGHNIVFSTFLGGTSSDTGAALGLDSTGNIYVQGFTRSADFPTKFAAQSNLAGEEDIFVAKLTPDGSSIIYSTYWGGSLGESFRGWPFYFGNSEIALDIGGIAVTPAGRVLVAGSTYSGDFPLNNALKTRSDDYALDAFATLFEPDGTIGFSTYFGGIGSDSAYNVAATPDGGFVFCGVTSFGNWQPDFPATPGAFHINAGAPDPEAFVVKIDTAPPSLSNDNFTNATSISTFTATLLAQTGASTKEPGEPAHNGNAGGKSVWYRWVPPFSGRAIVTTDGSNFPTLLAIYRGTTLANLTPVITSGTIDFSTYSEAKFEVTQDENLWIAVDGRDGASGFLNLSVSISLPANDDFENRATITGSTATVAANTDFATGERGDIGRKTVWWKWTPPTTGFYTLTTVGSDYNTALAVFTGSTLDQLQRLLAENSYTNNLARATFLAVAGTEYQIATYGDDGESGDVTLNLAPSVRPPNDDFSNRIRLNGRNELVTGTDFDSGFDQSERDLQILAESTIATGRIIWWEWTAPIDGAADITTTNTIRIASPDAAGTSMIVFAGDTFPTNKNDLMAVANAQGPASIFLTDVHAGTRYQIGLDAVDWQQSVQFWLKIRAIAPPRIIPTSVVIDATGNLTARIEGIEGHNYRVTASNDLKQWTSVGEFPAITGEFAFESAIGTGYRFFRAEEF